MKLLKTENGFSFVEVLVVLFVLAVVGGAGAYIYMNQDETISKSQGTTETESSNEDEVVGGSTDYTVDVPTNWAVIENEDMPFTARTPYEVTDSISITSDTNSTSYFGTAFSGSVNGLESEGFVITGQNDEGSISFQKMTGVDSLRDYLDEEISTAKAFGLEYDTYETHTEIINGVQWVRVTKVSKEADINTVSYLNETESGALYGVDFTPPLDDELMRQIVASVE